MPIAPENRARYPRDWPQLWEPLLAFLSTEEAGAIDLLRSSMAVDPTRSYQFFEALVARIVDGRLTAHKCGWDVELDAGGNDVRIEVKYAAESLCRFRSGARPVFKFANPRGAGEPKDAGALVLIGLDGQGDLHSWVLPRSAVGLVSSITLTSPKRRTGTSSRDFPIDEFRCPPSQILPEVLRANRCHLVYDGPHHAESRAARKRAAAATQELF